MTALYVVVLLGMLTCSWANLADTIQVSGEEIERKIRALAAFSEAENPAVTRILFTPEDLQGRNFVKSQMHAAGLDVSEDAMGTIYGTWAGSQPHLPTVATGSHCDAIPLSGMYDGVVGVLGAIEALAALNQAGFQPKRSIEVLMFTAEEPTRFGIGCIGSRAMAGRLPPPTLTTTLDATNATFMQAAAAAGVAVKSTPEATVKAVAARAAKIGYFLELHIEQGPELEAEGLDIGVVTAIAAPTTLRITFSGDGGHAGSQLMRLRNDAALAASEFCLAIEALVLIMGGPDSVVTCGQWLVEPNAVNSVPRAVTLHVDLRDVDGQQRDLLLRAIEASSDEVRDKRKVRVQREILNQDPPAKCAATVQAAVQDAADELPGVRSKTMVSHAYHDALFMAQFAPTGMIFIPCFKGYSHRPDEYASPASMATGVKVLALSLAELAGTAAESVQEEL